MGTKLRQRQGLRLERARRLRRRGAQGGGPRHQVCQRRKRSKVQSRVRVRRERDDGSRGGNVQEEGGRRQGSRRGAREEGGNRREMRHLLFQERKIRAVLSTRRMKEWKVTKVFHNQF